MRVAVSRDDSVGTPGAESDGQALRQTRVAGRLASAEAIGAMHASLAQAVEAAKDPIAFGRPIESFQATKHLLADTAL